MNGEDRSARARRTVEPDLNHALRFQKSNRLNFQASTLKFYLNPTSSIFVELFKIIIERTTL